MKSQFKTYRYHLYYSKAPVFTEQHICNLVVCLWILNVLLYETHIEMYTIWKVQVLAACCFLFQGIPSFIKLYTCILPIVHVFSLTELLSAGVFWLSVTLALTPNKTAACHLCIKLMTQYCSRRNSLNISFYLKGFRPILRKIQDFNQNEKISTAHGVPKRSPI